jgi:hypothetical protein
VLLKPGAWYDKNILIRRGFDLCIFLQNLYPFVANFSIAVRYMKGKGFFYTPYLYTYRRILRDFIVILILSI